MRRARLEFRNSTTVGGLQALGYEVRERRLVINPAEADIVRHIYERYLEVGCVKQLSQELERRGIISKVRVSRKGIESGGCRFSRGALYELLVNPIGQSAGRLSPPVRIGHKKATTRVHLPLSLDCRQTVQTVWRMTQSRSNPSLQLSSLLNRENKGNFPIFRQFLGVGAEKSSHSGCAFSKNSLEIETGNFKMVSGNSGSLFR